MNDRESAIPRRSHPWIAREGWSYLGVVSIAGSLLYLGFGWPGLAPAVVVFVVIAFLLRDPPSSIPCDPLALVSPVQGRVTKVESGLHDPWLDRDASCIHIRVSPLDVFSVRSPTEGKVEEQWCRVPDAAGAEHSRRFSYAFWTRTDEDDSLVTVVSAPRLPFLHRLQVSLQTGDRVGQGHRVAYLLLGGDVEVWTPVNVNTEVRPGDRVRSGLSTLAHLVHQQPATALRDEQ